MYEVRKTKQNKTRDEFVIKISGQSPKLIFLSKVKLPFEDFQKLTKPIWAQLVVFPWFTEGRYVLLNIDSVVV